MSFNVFDLYVGFNLIKVPLLLPIYHGNVFNLVNTSFNKLLNTLSNIFIN